MKDRDLEVVADQVGFNLIETPRPDVGDVLAPAQHVGGSSLDPWTGADEPALLEIHNATDQEVQPAAAGFLIAQSTLPAEVLSAWYVVLSRRAEGLREVGHFEVPAEISLSAIMADEEVRRAVMKHLPGGARLVHAAVHINPSGAVPLDWHRDDCRPWFDGPVAEAPPAVRIWLFPQAVPLDRGPIELDSAGSVMTATADAGSFIAVYDMALRHRQRANVSGLPRFMIRLEFVAARPGALPGDIERAADTDVEIVALLRQKVEALVEELRYSVDLGPGEGLVSVRGEERPTLDVLDAEPFLARLSGIFGAQSAGEPRPLQAKDAPPGSDQAATTTEPPDVDLLLVEALKASLAVKR